MELLYVDESGSMTARYNKNNPYFVITLIRVSQPQKIRTLHKRFVSKYKKDLIKADTAERMFSDNCFKELKGSMFTPSLKREFVSYFCRPDTFEAYYIVIDNSKISEGLYKNTARAFNYVLKLAISYFIKRGFLPDDQYVIQLDERNEKTQSKYFLENYLNTELRMSGIISSDIEVKYFDSSKNKIIQIADVMANLYYSQLITNAYDKEMQVMKDSGCLKFIFQFPLAD